VRRRFTAEYKLRVLREADRRNVSRGLRQLRYEISVVW
jgi:hypothetical protein